MGSVQPPFSNGFLKERMLCNHLELNMGVTFWLKLGGETVKTRQIYLLLPSLHNISKSQSCHPEISAEIAGSLLGRFVKVAEKIRLG